MIYEPKVWMQSMPGLLAGLVVPVSKPASAAGWVYGGGGGGGGAVGSLHFVVSESTDECFDTASTKSLDLWDCVADGHNSRRREFRHSAGSPSPVSRRLNRHDERGAAK